MRPRRSTALPAWLAIAVLALGLWPAPLLDVMRPTLEQLVQQMMMTKL